MAPRGSSAEVKTVGVQCGDDVDFDDHDDKRYKDSKVAVQESSTHAFRDYPVEGPAVCLEDLAAMTKIAGDPRRWLERWLIEKGFGENDRLAHEMHVLADCLFHAATYDQLNVGSVVCLEVVARRLQAIVDAHSVSASKPN